ncbi:MAG: hypothetical protein VYA80_07840 [Pseudomonadota bacterium]|nr:hypothetical protein [Pseudomonadota bacterium]
MIIIKFLILFQSLTLSASELHLSSMEDLSLVSTKSLQHCIDDGSQHSSIDEASHDHKNLNCSDACQFCVSCGGIFATHTLSSLNSISAVNFYSDIFPITINFPFDSPYRPPINL